jgi:hypothetical protein
VADQRRSQRKTRSKAMNAKNRPVEGEESDEWTHLQCAIIGATHRAGVAAVDPRELQQAAGAYALALRDGSLDSLLDYVDYERDARVQEPRRGVIEMIHQLAWPNLPEEELASAVAAWTQHQDPDGVTRLHDRLARMMAALPQNS